MIDQIWQYLGECYIERRNFEISATSHMDGGISCLSGRTAAIRTKILQTQDFITGYVTETWLGIPLNADDDNFVTRLLVAKGWGIRIQILSDTPYTVSCASQSRVGSQTCQQQRYSPYKASSGTAGS
jgi:hypothetical protein